MSQEAIDTAVRILLNESSDEAFHSSLNSDDEELNYLWDEARYVFEEFKTEVNEIWKYINQHDNPN